MACECCGKDGAKVQRITRSYGRGKNMFLIENIPVVSCPHCGESYFEADTLHEIERLKLHRKEIAVERTVPVMSFS